MRLGLKFAPPFGLGAGPRILAKRNLALGLQLSRVVVLRVRRGPASSPVPIDRDLGGGGFCFV